MYSGEASVTELAEPFDMSMPAISRHLKVLEHYRRRRRRKRMPATIDNPNAAGADTAEREIRATRVFDAPRELVFDAWTKPEYVAQWWGPNGFTITTFEMDVRTGGTWRFVMHGPDGRDYQNRFDYVEVVRPERIVYDHITGPLFHATATFEEQDGKTTVTVRMLFETAELREHVAREYGAVEGLEQTLSRLEGYLRSDR
jgi:uncharacterized protein YndB with AHSA1/START domain